VLVNDEDDPDRSSALSHLGQQTSSRLPADRRESEQCPITTRTQRSWRRCNLPVFRAR
jgi:hypothetical protein